MGRNDFLKAVGERVKRERESQGLNQRELSAKTPGVSTGYVTQIEQGPEQHEAVWPSGVGMKHK